MLILSCVSCHIGIRAHILAIIVVAEYNLAGIIFSGRTYVNNNNNNVANPMDSNLQTSMSEKVSRFEN